MIKAFEVRIEGTAPLLMHRFPMEPIEAIEKKSKEEQAEIAAYRIPSDGDKQANLYVPGVAFQRALVGGATFSKGKGRATLQKQVAACMFVSPDYLDLGVSNYIIDARPVVVPATRGRVMRFRPKLEKWAFNCRVEFDDSLISNLQARQIVDDAGLRVGLLEFRPERKGPFGRFKVTHWKELKN